MYPLEWTKQKVEKPSLTLSKPFCSSLMQLSSPLTTLNSAD